MPRTTTPEPATTPDFADLTTDEQLAEALSLEQSLPEQSYAAVPEEAPRQVDFIPDLALLQAAHGDPDVWAKQLAAMVSAVSGSEFAPESISEWLRTYSSQVQQVAMRNALFQVANTELPAHIQGDPAMLMLRLRDDIAGSFRHAAGLR